MQVLSGKSLIQGDIQKGRILDPPLPPVHVLPPITWFVFLLGITVVADSAHNVITNTVVILFLQKYTLR